MMDFLEFLNTSDAEAIKHISGMTPALADHILSTRPFAALEDVLKVKGMTEKKWSALPESYAQSQKESSEKETAAVEILPEESAEPVDTQEPTEEKPKRSNVWGRVITWLVVLLLLGAGVFSAIKWGLPYMYEKYVKPVENNTANLTDLASQQSAEVTRLDEEIAALQERIATLEQRADAVDLSLKAHDETLAQLEDMQNLLDQKIDTQKTDLMAELSNQITLTRAVDLISRSRLYLSESNFGLAKTDLETSRNLLYSLLDVLPENQISGLKIVINRIDMALENLPAYPVVAVYDVDTAWQLLIDGLPNIPAQAVTPVVLPSTPTQTAVPAGTATLEPTIETTATAAVAP